MKIALRQRPLILLALALLTFLPFVGRRDFVTSHEARVALVARQMAESGWPWHAARVYVPQVELAQTAAGERLVSRSDKPLMSVNPWLVPVMLGQIRLQKPPLPYWCTAIVFKLAGYGTTQARLVPALLGACATLLVFNLARHAGGRVQAWYAGLIWVSSYFVVDEFRKSMADPYLAFFTLLALWAWITSINNANAAGRIFIFYLALALGTLCKGPLIFLFVIVALAAFHLAQRRRFRGNWKPHALGSALLFIIALPWVIAMLRTVPHAVELWRYESVGAFADKTEKARAWWFYIPSLLQITLPWTPIMLFGLARIFRHTTRRRLFPLLPTALVVLVFSLALSKKNAYLLPVMPLLAIFGAQGLVALTVLFRAAAWNRPVRKPIARALAVAVVLCCATQLFLSGWLALHENLRSPKYISDAAARLLDENSGLSLLTSRLPEEAAAYIPQRLLERQATDDALLIVDNRAGTPEGNLQVKLAGLDVKRVAEMTSPKTTNNRWRAYRILLSKAPRAAPTTMSTEDRD